MKIYFDNAATTPLHPKVFEKMKPFLMEEFGNPSSIHSFGRKVRVAIEDARETVAEFIGANPSEIYFTSGGTEANNFTVRGIAQTEFSESKRNKIITSKAEHHSVLDSFDKLSNQGFNVQWLNVKRDSSADIEQLGNLVDNSTSLISIIHANNETGTINPVQEISSLAKRENIYIHSDTVQSFGKIKINVNELGIHSLTASAHKINGPKGLGFAYIKSGTPASPLIFGGSQERNRRGGTENAAAIVGFAQAIQIARDEMQNNFEHVNKIRNSFLNGILSIGDNKIMVNGGKNILPYILSITFPSEYFYTDAEAMLMFLDINGVAASNGAACTSGTLKPSHVMLNSGYSPADASGTVRFSFGTQNTMEEVEFVLQVLKKMAGKFKKH